MIRYGELVSYIKKNHISWNTNLFEVLEGFFEEYSFPQHSLTSSQPIQKELFPGTMDALDELTNSFQAPSNGEYSTQDVLDLFST